MVISNRHHTLIALAAIALTTQAAARSPLVPNRNAIPSEQPTAPARTALPSVTCTATGTWTDEFGSGPGTFTRTAKKHCGAPGTWTDAYSYTWKVKKDGKGQLTGTVNYHGIAECTDQIWPVTGTYDKKNFSVTATNPASDDCSTFFTYVLTIQ